MLLSGADWVSKPSLRRAFSAFHSTVERADTSCEGRAAGGARRCSSSSDLSLPVVTSYTPQSGLLLTCHSPPGAPSSTSKPFINDLVQLSAIIWHTVHVRKQADKKNMALFTCVSVWLGVGGHCAFLNAQC